MKPLRSKQSSTLANAQYLAGLSKIMLIVILAVLVALASNWLYGLSTGE